MSFADPGQGYEEEIARWWWSLPSGSLLPASNGATYILLFAGSPGGSSGPDVRDAVFRVTYRPLLSAIQPHRFPLSQVAGDVEFHIHAHDWFAHGHQRDAHYNQVILHVVRSAEENSRTLRQDGALVPICCLYNVIEKTTIQEVEHTLWPCLKLIPDLEAGALERYLILAGTMRFEQKTHALVESVHRHMQSFVENEFSTYDQILLATLAEALGYGRDRHLFRAIGSSLIYRTSTLDALLKAETALAPLDRRRLYSLAALIESWRAEGAWPTFREILLLEQTAQECLQALHRLLCSSGLSLARTDILVCNVILPFAAAIGLIEGNLLLYERSLALYMQHPGLSPNRVTRFMCDQLQLKTLPRGTCQQQGLQHIYQQTCREKHCGECMLGKRRL